MAKQVRRTPVRRAKPPQSMAGGPAVASVAATEPMAGAFYDAPGDYQPDDSRSPLAARFVEEVRENAMPLERGGTVDREVGESMAAEAIDDDAALQAEIERIRQFRKPLGAFSQKLDLPKRRGYHRHWFNDTAGRVQEAEANGWAHVADKDGKPICRCVGSGRDRGALYAFAMELPLFFWEEDMAQRNRAAADKMAHLKANPFQAGKGMTNASDAGKFYNPSETGGPIQISKG